MSTPISTEQKIEKIISLVENKKARWAQSISFGYGTSIPLGWTVKNEPGELAKIARSLIKENELLRSEIELLKTNR